MRALAVAERYLDRIIVMAAILAAIIVVALFVSISYEVVMRYFFSAPTSWASETSEYALFWIAFLSAAWVLREEAHVKIDMLTEILPPRTQQIFHTATSIAGACVSAVFCWVSLLYILKIHASGEMLFKSLVLPKWAVMSVMVPGLALLAVQFVRRAALPPPQQSTSGL